MYDTLGLPVSNEPDGLCSKLCQDVIALKEKCVKDGSHYVKSIIGGKDQSIEGIAVRCPSRWTSVDR